MGKWEKKRGGQYCTVLGFGNVSEALRTCKVHTLVRSGFNSSKCLYWTIPPICIFQRVSM